MSQRYWRHIFCLYLSCDNITLNTISAALICVGCSISFQQHRSILYIHLLRVWPWGDEVFSHHALVKRLGDTDISPVHYTVNTLTDKQTHTYRQFSVSVQFSWPACLWTVTGNPSKHRGNIKTTLRKDKSWVVWTLLELLNNNSGSKATGLWIPMKMKKKGLHTLAPVEGIRGYTGHTHLFLWQFTVYPPFSQKAIGIYESIPTSTSVNYYRST